MKRRLKLERDIKTSASTEESKSESMSRSTSYSNLDAEKVLEGFGTFGTYQVWLYSF